MEIKEIPILFIGQCKNGTNAMTDFLVHQKGFISGETVKASCRERVEEKLYYSNWDKRDLTHAKYLIDKALIVPYREYYNGKGDLKNNKLIYMLRNPYEGIKSHFLVALRGETCYHNFISKIPREYISEEEILKLSFTQVCSIIERNPLKIMHTLIIPKLVRFFPRKNIFFTTLEDMKEGKNELKRLEKFLQVKFSGYKFSDIGKTIDKYSAELNLYKAGQTIFDKYQVRIFKKYIHKIGWERISDYFGKNLVKEYDIQ